MGRYPYLAWKNIYMTNCGLNVKTTAPERERRLERIYGDLEDLKKRGRDRDDQSREDRP